MTNEELPGSAAKNIGRPHCAHVRPDGKRCNAWARSGHAVCYVHSLDKEARSELGRLAGVQSGLSRAARDCDRFSVSQTGPERPNKLQIAALEELRDLLEWAHEDCRASRAQENEGPDGKPRSETLKTCKVCDIIAMYWAAYEPTDDEHPNNPKNQMSDEDIERCQEREDGDGL